MYASGPSGVSAFSVERCTSYMLCPDCVSNKDPYCAWKDGSCVQSSTITEKSDITAPSQCPDGMLPDLLFFHSKMAVQWNLFMVGNG